MLKNLSFSCWRMNSSHPFPHHKSRCHVKISQLYRKYYDTSKKKTTSITTPIVFACALLYCRNNIHINNQQFHCVAAISGNCMKTNERTTTTKKRLLQTKRSETIHISSSRSFDSGFATEKRESCCHCLFLFCFRIVHSVRYVEMYESCPYYGTIHPIEHFMHDDCHGWILPKICACLTSNW